MTSKRIMIVMNYDTLNEKRMCKSIMILTKKPIPIQRGKRKGRKLFFPALVPKNVERMIMICTDN